MEHIKLNFYTLKSRQIIHKITAKATHIDNIICILKQYDLINLTRRAISFRLL